LKINVIVEIVLNGLNIIEMDIWWFHSVVSTQQKLFIFWVMSSFHINVVINYLTILN